MPAVLVDLGGFVFTRFSKYPEVSATARKWHSLLTWWAAGIPVTKVQANSSKGLNGSMFHKVSLSSLKLLVISESMHVCLKHDIPVKALGKQPMFSMVSCYKENRFFLNLCKWLWLPWKKYLLRDLLNFRGFRQREKLNALICSHMNTLITFLEVIDILRESFLNPGE